MNKKIAIMQPYFMPYIGYFQLINLVDEFVIYDNIEYTKKGWINRNRICLNGKDTWITLPLKKNSDYLHISKRELAEEWLKHRKKILYLIENAYKKSPNFSDVMSLIERCVNFSEKNLFQFIYHSITLICNYLEIKTPIIISSSIDIEHSLKSNSKVLAICRSRKANTYINPIGGIALYDKNEFLNSYISLFFLQSNHISYKQFDNNFIPWLSIIDVMMFNPKNIVQNFLNEFVLI